MRESGLVLIFIVAVFVAFPQKGVAKDSASRMSTQALKECHRGRVATERSVRLEHFERAEALAEQAVALDEQLAAAHFALFCSLGEQLRIDGESVSMIFGFGRVIDELDRTLALNPNHLDALSAKGTFLVRLPALFGGDVEKGEQLLRRVIQEDPRAVNARLTLARCYGDRGNHQQALELAEQALKLAKAESRADLLPEAQFTVSELRRSREAIVTAHR